ncbi:hypothetical protein SEA_ASHTON_18 [Microbacterium phage Ashton]|nr:hypothetical protein SEA_TRUONG_18 [Microbacterium phage Truong]QJD51757.1 hypothetical protein SEA_ASHTON_18 [Microbacterium phage Ashton]
MARIITTEQPVVVYKERRLEIASESLARLSVGDIEDGTASFRRKEQIPDEVLGKTVKGENAWDVDVIIWGWWEITV